jgi:hypothetical protein
MKQRNLWSTVLLAGAFVTAERPAGAQGTVDQENLVSGPTTSSSCGVGPGSISQGFIPSLSPLIAVELRGYTAGGGATVRIRDGAVDGTILGEVTIGAVLDGWNRFDLAGTGVNVVPGQLYVIEYVSPLSWGMNLTDTYPAGTAYGCTNTSIPTRDAVFRTYAPSVVPVDRTTWGRVKSRYRP